MSMSDLPEMYVCPKSKVQPKDYGHTFHTNHKCPCYSNTSIKSNSLNLNMSVSYIYTSSPERSDYVASNVEWMSPMDITENSVGQIAGKLNAFVD